MSLFSPQDDIWSATKRGDLEKVREFVVCDGIPCTEDDWNPDSLLSVACAAGHAHIVRFLLEQGARSTRYIGRAPEAFIAMRRARLDVLRVLCEFGLDPNGTEYSKHGESLIIRALQERRADVVRLLLEHGAEIHTYLYGDEMTEEEIEGNSPSEIELAARAGDEEFVDFLLEVGVPLGDHNATYYRKKARQSAAKFEQKQAPNQGPPSERGGATSNANSGDVALGCLVWTMLGTVLVWLCRFFILQRE